MLALIVTLTIIQFGVLIYLLLKVRTISDMLEEQQMENNEILVALKNLKERKEEN